MRNKMLTEHSVKKEEDPIYDSPNGCVAIVAVGEDGDYFFMQRPDIWCLDVEPDPKNNGFGDCFDLAPGVYKMTFLFNPYRDYESGYVDDWDFTLEKSELLWEFKGN